MAFRVSSPSFNAGGDIPARYTCDAQNHAPALEWSGAPPGTRSFALLCEDPDAPVGVWTHWMLWNLPPDCAGLFEAGSPPAGALEGLNDFGKPGFGGPCPPRGHGAHRYFFRVYALGAERLDLKNGARRPEFDRALRGLVLAQADWMGRYERR